MRPNLLEICLHFLSGIICFFTPCVCVLATSEIDFSYNVNATSSQKVVLRNTETYFSLHAVNYGNRLARIVKYSYITY